MNGPEGAESDAAEAALGFAGLLGVEVMPAPAGEARLRTQVGERHVNLHGSAHGGFLYSLADEAFALASNSREADAVALSVRMDYFMAVRIGDVLEARASEEHLGRSVGTYRVEIRRLAPVERAPGGRPAETEADALTVSSTPRADPGATDGTGRGTSPSNGPLVALFTGTAYRRPRQDETDDVTP